MKGYSSLLRSPELEHPDQMQFSFIASFLGASYSLYRIELVYGITNPAERVVCDTKSTFNADFNRF